MATLKELRDERLRKLEDLKKLGVDFKKKLTYLPIRELTKKYAGKE